VRQAYAIQHVAFEDAGVFEDVLYEDGWNLIYLQAGVDDLSPALDCELLVVMGGPIGVYEETDYPFLTEEIALLAARLAADRPTLGVCLGSQLMAKALGARVYKGPAKEIGFAPLQIKDERLSDLEGLSVLHWHGDTYDLPTGCELLASTEITPHQGFARGANLLALQFHPEVRGAYFETWLIGATGELAEVGLSPVSLRADGVTFFGDLEPAAKTLFRRWLAGLA
jgi:GMP synthase (glutamine-hydrolysing)